MVARVSPQPEQFKPNTNLEGHKTSVPLSKKSPGSIHKTTGKTNNKVSQM